MNFFVGIDTVPTSTCTMNVHSIQYIKIKSDKKIHTFTDIMYMNIIRSFSKRSEQRKKCCDRAEFPNAFSMCKFDTN